MFQKLTFSWSVRLIHTSAITRAVDKGQLSKLRKKTGFPFINCKKALEKFNNDLKQAEKWLREEAQKEGWAKASKLQNRPMSQGLVGLIRQNNMAAMVEVNCETDFVSRNNKFRDLVSLAASTCLHQGQRVDSGKVCWNKEAVNQLTTEDGRALADAVAMEVGGIGENMALRRGLFFRAQPGAAIGQYIHSAGEPAKSQQCLMGKFGSLVVFASPTADSDLSPEALGRQLCQHVVGMNPKSLGNADDAKPAKDKDAETQLIFQEFLMDASTSVGEFVAERGSRVLDFARYECGEELEEQEDEGSSAAESQHS